MPPSAIEVYERLSLPVLPCICFAGLWILSERFAGSQIRTVGRFFIWESCYSAVHFMQFRQLITNEFVPTRSGILTPLGGASFIA